jgi:hypothetical protein
MDWAIRGEGTSMRAFFCLSPNKPTESAIGVVGGDALKAQAYHLDT